MRREEALLVLGVEPGAGAQEVRSAFRRAVLEAHPDTAGPDAGAAAAVDRLVDALAALRSLEAAPSPSTATAAAAEGEELVVVAPPDEAFVVLLAAADTLGEITHAEPENGLFEILLSRPGTAPSSVLVTLQGRGGTTEAFCTLEPLVPGRPPPVLADVVAELAAAISQPAPGGTPGVASGHAAEPGPRGPGP